MKKIFVFLMMVCVTMVANANLVLTFQDAEGNTVTVDKDTTVNVVSMDPEEYELGINGTILDQKGALTIDILRDNTGVLDVCCAAGNCINGNGELTQHCSYTLDNDNTWFAHVEAPEGADTYHTTIVYTFQMGADTRVLTVEYYYMCSTALETNVARKQCVKRVVNGQMVIEKNGQLYNLLGARID